MERSSQFMRGLGILHGVEPPVEVGGLESPYFLTYPTLLHLRISIEVALKGETLGL